MKRHVGSAVKGLRSGQKILLMKKKDGISGGLSEKQKARLRRKLPAYLRSAHSWLCFKFQTAPNRDRAKKVPIDPETGQGASYKDPAAWGTLEEAIAGCARFHADGVGYAFMYWDNIVGLDLDNCRNPATGKIDQWASEIIDETNSYSEVTPSGTGVRVFMDGKWRHPEHRTEGLGSAGKGSLEIYSEWFFTITGDHLRGTRRKIECRSDVISQLHTRFSPLQDRPAHPPFGRQRRSLMMTLPLSKKPVTQKMATNSNDYGREIGKEITNPNPKPILPCAVCSHSGRIAMRSAWITCSAGRAYIAPNGMRNTSLMVRPTETTPSASPSKTARRHMVAIPVKLHLQTIAAHRYASPTCNPGQCNGFGADGFRKVRSLCWKATPDWRNRYSR
jgi:hypothetical protein